MSRLYLHFIVAFHLGYFLYVYVYAHVRRR